MSTLVSITGYLIMQTGQANSHPQSLNMGAGLWYHSLTELSYLEKSSRELQPEKWPPNVISLIINFQQTPESWFSSPEHGGRKGEGWCLLNGLLHFWIYEEFHAEEMEIARTGGGRWHAWQEADFVSFCFIFVSHWCGRRTVARMRQQVCKATRVLVIKEKREYGVPTVFPRFSFLLIWEFGSQSLWAYY